jgi:hypothetical protein
VQYSGGVRAHTIREWYFCRVTDSVEAVIGNVTAGYERNYDLGKRAAKHVAVTPGKKKRRAREAH